jgi:hypothetical protein
MNREHLGDALDHWKGSLISILYRHRLIHDLRVVPMMTHPPEWTDEDWSTYARLLKCRLADIRSRDLPFFNRAKARKEYFERVMKEDSDLFLDPDIGIKANGNEQYIKIQEIRDLLMGAKKNGRLLMIYQHSARNNPRLHFVGIAGRLEASIPGAHIAVYDGTQAGMFFISWDGRRIHAIERTLRGHLGGTAEKRVWDP